MPRGGSSRTKSLSSLIHPSPGGCDEGDDVPADSLSFTSFPLRDADSADRIRFRADYTLGTGNNGINPRLESVTVKLTTLAGVQVSSDRVNTFSALLVL
jgi:hypothetical protein